MDVRAEIERVEARIDWLLALVQELQKRDDEVTAKLLQKAETDLETARHSLERAKTG
jgi:predicted transcriptional regulator